MVFEQEVRIMSHLMSITNGLLTISIIFTDASLLQAQDMTSFTDIPRIDPGCLKERHCGDWIFVFDFEFFLGERCDFYIGLHLVSYTPQQISSLE